MNFKSMKIQLIFEARFINFQTLEESRGISSVARPDERIHPFGRGLEQSINGVLAQLV